MIDSHTHLTLLDDPDGALQRAGEAGVTGVVTIGTSVESARQALAIAETAPAAVRVGVGVHPAHAAAFDLETWPELELLASHRLVCAIGETGFDMYRDNGPIERQQDVFELHCDLARRHGYPLVVHSRAADQHTIDALAAHAGDLTVIMHCFSMPHRVEEVVERGYYVSFAGNVTYGSAGDLRDAVRKVPRDRLLAETDAPYLAPVPRRGRHNEPAYVVHTVAVLADALGEPAVAIGETTARNARQAFQWPS